VNRPAAAYARALYLGVVVILWTWHFGYDILIISRGWPVYPSHLAAAGAWLVVAVVQVLGSVLQLRGRLGTATAWVLAGLALAGSVLAVYSYPPGQVVSDVSWAWNTVGWCGVLLLIQRPLRELVGFLAVNTAITVIPMAAQGTLDRVTLGRVAIVTYAVVGAQLLFAVVAHHLDAVALRATDLTLARAESQSRTAVDDAVHAERQRRYAEVSERVEPLMRGLAGGSLDVADPEVRRVAGIEAARLRRLFAETDDTPNPLLHELRACADLAERRGLEIAFLTYGDVPEMPTDVRRFLAEVLLLVLSSAASRARLTTVADPAEVVMSVVADAPADVLANLRATVPMSIVHDPEQDQLWVEVRWQKPSVRSG
jgi:hypothetical protein